MTETARQLHHRFTHGETTAEAIADACLARIAKHDSDVGAFLTVFETRLREKARALDAKRAAGDKLGRLAGVPIAIKDNIHVKDELTTCASKFLANYRAPFDATVTELLEQEDALIVGKTNLDEFAMGSSNEHSAFKPTRNPWNLECVPGGSSGGSAAAVAARLVPLALGSDTGGSVRQPASFCGVVGMKPTYGRVSRYGLVAFGSSLDQIGPLATSSDDIAMVMEVIGAPDPCDATTLSNPAEDYLLDGKISGKTIGVPRAFLADLPPETAEAFEASLEVYRSLGCEIVDIDLCLLRYSVATYYIVATAEASTNLARFDGVRYGVRSDKARTLDEVYHLSRSEGFGMEVQKRILLGTYVLSSGFQDAYYKRATRVRAKIVEQYAAAFAQCDLIATPTAPTAAFKAGAIADPVKMYLQDIYTIGANLAHLPAISLPCGFAADNKPLGLHLTGPRRSDVLVCRAAHAFEAATEFAQAIPPGFER